MSSPYLPLAVKNISMTLEDILSHMRNPSYKLLYFNRIADLYRQLGIGEYLMCNQVSALHKNLRLGVQAYIEFLKRAQAAEKATSETSVFFDATCLADTDALRELAQLAPQTPNSRKEYEEDFFYMRILMNVFGLGHTKAQVQPLLDEYKALTAQAPDDRYTLICSLLEKDDDAFKDILTDLINTRLMQYEEGGDQYQGTQDEAVVLAHVSTEVMAWLKFAQQQGIVLESDEYALAPSSAMATCSLPALAPQSWLRCDSHRSLSFLH